MSIDANAATATRRALSGRLAERGAHGAGQ